MSKKYNRIINSILPIFFICFAIFFALQYRFPSFDNGIYDFFSRYLKTNFDLKDVVVIRLNEESDEFLGDTYPYTYASHKTLLERISQESIAGLLYLFTLDPMGQEEEPEHFKAFKSSLNTLLKANTPVLFSGNIDPWGPQEPPAGLQEFSFFLSGIPFDLSGNIPEKLKRKLVLSYAGHSSETLVFANLLRQKRKKKTLLPLKISGASYHEDLDAVLSLYRYSVSPLNKGKWPVPTFNFYEVMQGDYPAEIFKDKFVIVAPEYLGRTGNYIQSLFSPSERDSSRIKIFLNELNALVGNKTIKRIPDLYVRFFVFLFALMISFFIAKLSPSQGLSLILVLTLASFLIALALFLLGFWINIAYLLVTIFIVYIIWIPSRAISEYKKRYAIEKETKILKQVDHLKQNFISLMSHDLKTPIAKIIGLGETLLRIEQDPLAVKKYAKSILRTTDELNSFVSSILDLTKVESQEVALHLQSEDLNEVILEVTKKLRFRIKQNEIKVVEKLEPLYPINMDKRLVERVVSNLIENAIKYSGKGSEVILSTFDDQDWVYFSVADNGVGIDEESLKNIFDKFYRVKDDRIHEIKGSGLGLYLAKYFIELHGGEITVSSQKGQGTKFSIKLANK